ncbi:MAG: hypothetical protein ACJ796_19500 [Gemmatimonadaceae bacterium]
MHYVRRVVLIAAVPIAAGCHIGVSETNLTNCPTSAVISAGVDIVDFKQRIQKQTAVAPPDSILDVVLTFDGAINQADLDAITAAGGTNVSNTGSVAGVRASFRAQALADYVANDQGRLTNAIIYIPSCTAV